ncbi:ABC transporter ATP-binding protein [Saccharicrinis sp. FJH54]|uniref:ABC transporter ATP-binding protein n=1 Tax=Saccharicrinis sp. FJH54 TaxID=3344665 RepID=UPI0035D414F9
MLKLDKIQKGFGTPGAHDYHQVLNDLSLQVEKGEAIAVTGPSGSGKSTLLNIIGSLDRPDKGTVVFNDRNLENFSKDQLQMFRNSNIGFVFQLHHLFPQCTLFENVMIPTLPLKDKSGSAERAEKLIREMGLWDRRNDKPATLSGGECQRTAVIRALINNPSLILADEPTGALDEENAAALIDLLLEINKTTGTTLIVVTHSLELAGRMQKVYRLTKGKLEQKK